MSTETQPTPQTLLRHLRVEAGDFTVPRRPRSPRWADQAFHEALYRWDPGLYGLGALWPGVSTSMREQVAFQLLRGPREHLSKASAELTHRAAALLLSALPAASALKVFLGLRRARVNRRFGRQMARLWILNHPDLEALVVQRRPAVLDILSHAVGHDTLRGALRGVIVGRSFDPRLVGGCRQSGRFAGVAAYLLGEGPAPTPLAPAIALGGAREAVAAARPKTVTATNRGPLSAALVNIYQGGETQALGEAVDEAIDGAAARLPHLEGRLGIVLDASLSMQGYGSREWCNFSQAVALSMVLSRVCADRVEVRVGGGKGRFFRAAGASDLATGLLAVAASSPEVIAVITDGYENIHAGDLAATAKALPQAGVCAPVFVWMSQFTGQDDLTLRQCAPRLETRSFWHQQDFAPLIVELFSSIPGPRGRDNLQRALHLNLQRREAEVNPWLH